MVELIERSATELADMIRNRKISCEETLDAFLAQVVKWNPVINAVVSECRDEARQTAKQLDEKLDKGEEIGVLGGLPIAHKDLVQTEGLRTTWGSRIYADFIPSSDDLIVQRLKSAGAVTIGKTNTPEFGAGSQTFNEVFGATRNPYDRTRTVGGSSGGAAAALAARMIPIADGSDMGGSLRNPASFCNVIGFRSSTGLVPVWPTDEAWFGYSVQGPMARTVEDIALQLQATVGFDRRVPLSLHATPADFAGALGCEMKGLRIAYSRTLGGLPVDPAVIEVLDQAVLKLQDCGMDVVEVDPDLRGADEVFKTWRAYRFAMKFGPLIERSPELVKDTIHWNVNEGRKLSAKDLARANELRTQLFERMTEFMGLYDYLLCPTVQTPPFDIDVPYLESINDVKFDTYVDWMKSCYLITVTGLPALSMPAGFTENGLPVGIQLVGGYHADRAVLDFAHEVESILQFASRAPVL